MARGKSGPAVWISIQLRTRTPRPPAGGGRPTSCWFWEEAALGGVSSKLAGRFCTPTHQPCGQLAKIERQTTRAAALPFHRKSVTLP
jgi:hypothetical protein